MKAARPLRYVLFIMAILSFWWSTALSLQHFKEPIDSRDSPVFEVDLVNLASKEPGASRMDLYIRVPYSELQFIKSNDEFKAQFRISISVFDNARKFMDSETIKEEVIADNLDETTSTETFIVRKSTFDLPPGEYEVTLDLKDLETKDETQQIKPISLRDYSTMDILTSDLLYLDSYSIDEEDNLDLRPRVSGIKSENLNLLAYVEVYNVPENDSILVYYEVLNKDNESLQSHEFVTSSEGRATRVFVEIAGEKLPLGRHMTRIKFSHKDHSTEIERGFSWYIDGVPETFTNLDQAIEVLEYIASAKEIKELQKTPKGEKQAAFIEFWKKYDPTPQTPENERRRQYYSRIQFANNRFHGIRKPGWKTDMGWVYVLLGSPDTIERNPFNQAVTFSRVGRTIKASELWIYYKYNKQLLFLDEQGFGDYRLENRDTLFEIMNLND